VHACLKDGRALPNTSKFKFVVTASTDERASAAPVVSFICTPPSNGGIYDGYESAH